MLVTFMRTIKGSLKRQAIGATHMQIQRVVQNILIVIKYAISRKKKMHHSYKNIIRSIVKRWLTNVYGRIEYL